MRVDDAPISGDIDRLKHQMKRVSIELFFEGFTGGVIQQRRRENWNKDSALEISLRTEKQEIAQERGMFRRNSKREAASLLSDDGCDVLNRTNFVIRTLPYISDDLSCEISTRLNPMVDTIPNYILITTNRFRTHARQFRYCFRTELWRYVNEC